MNNNTDINELCDLFENYTYGFNTPINEYKELEQNIKMLEEIKDNYISNKYIYDLNNDKTISIDDFILYIQNKNHIYLNKINFINKVELNIKDKFINLNNIKDQFLYIKYTLNIYIQLINYINRINLYHIQY